MILLGGGAIPKRHQVGQFEIGVDSFPAQPTEVVIIGTRHSAQLEYEDHAPARIRALLNRIDPAAVGIETTPAWFAEELYFEIAYESYGVAVPWAREKGKEVRAVDWQAGTLEFMSALSWPNTGELRDAAEERLSLDQWDMRELLFADSPEWRDAVHREYASPAPDPNPWNEATRRYMLYRNLMIAREIANLAADYDGQKQRTCLIPRPNFCGLSGTPPREMWKRPLSSSAFSPGRHNGRTGRLLILIAT